MTAANEMPVGQRPLASPYRGLRPTVAAGGHLGAAPERSARERAARQRAARRRAARRRGHRRLALIVLVCIAVSLLALSLTGSRPKSSPAGVGSQHASVVASPVLRSSLPPAIATGGRAALLPFPRKGEGAVVVGGLGLVGASRDERSVPIASVTKIMTAYLVLKDHPLVGRSGGPVFTMTAADHKAWIEASEADESNVEVKAGERLDERQLLQALMIPSADNIADYLAVWDAGSMRAFVAKMNAAAVALHLTGTHFADASGLNPASRGTAVDMARLAAVAMMNPVLQSITDEKFIRLPVAGEIWNNDDPAVGVDGIIGVKSGFTAAAETNLVTAAWRTVRGHRVLVVCDVLHQVNTLLGDAWKDEALLEATSRELKMTTVLPGGTPVGEATAAWNHESSVVRLAAPAALVGWPGLRLTPQLVPRPAPASAAKRGWPAGSVIGTLELRYPYGGASSEPVVLQSQIGPPPSGWRPSGSLR